MRDCPVPTQAAPAINLKKRDVALAAVAPLAAVAGIVVAQFPATAQNRVGSQHHLPASSIAHVAARAALLHRGMSQADIAGVMGAPSQVSVADDEGTVRVLRYSAEPIEKSLRAHGEAKTELANLDERDVEEIKAHRSEARLNARGQPK